MSIPFQNLSDPKKQFREEGARIWANLYDMKQDVHYGHLSQHKMRLISQLKLQNDKMHIFMRSYQHQSLFSVLISLAKSSYLAQVGTLQESFS